MNQESLNIFLEFIKNSFGDDGSQLEIFLAGDVSTVEIFTGTSEFKIIGESLIIRVKGESDEDFDEIFIFEISKIVLIRSI